MGQVIIVRGRLAKRLREEAERLGVSINEYLVELLSQDLDPKDRAIEYIEVAQELLNEAREELKKGDVRQVAEKVWDAGALTMKAYAYWRERKRLVSHGELWRYVDVLTEELGDWVHDSWMNAASMHVCFYEGWCTERSVYTALKQVERLVKEVASKVKS